MPGKEKISDEESFKRRWFTRANDASYSAYYLSRTYGDVSCKKIRRDVQALKDLFRVYSSADIDSDPILQIEMDRCLRPVEERLHGAKKHLEDEAMKRREAWRMQAQVRRHSPI